MESSRRLLFALVAAAMMLNIGYGLMNNGLRIPILERNDIDLDENALSDPFAVSELVEGSAFTSTYNMSVDVDLKDEKGRYFQEGTLKRTVGKDAISKTLSGTYSLIYNGTQDLSFIGEIQNSRITEMNERGLESNEQVSSRITFNGPKGFGSSSEVETTIEEFRGLRMDMIWKALVPSDHQYNLSSKGTESVPVNLQEAGIRTDEIVISWKAVSLKDSLEGRVIRIRATSPIKDLGSIILEFSILEGSSWPSSMSIVLEGRFETEDGFAEITMTMNENLMSWTPGSGKTLPFIVYGPYGPPNMKAGNDYPLLPDEGGETGFRFAPQEALQVCMDRGTLLKDYIRGKGWDGLTLLEADYYKLELVDPVWVWNITLSAPAVEGSPAMICFEVGVEGGGLIDQKRYTLISESISENMIHPEGSSGMITLGENENTISESDFDDQFLKAEGYQNSYRLDISRREAACCDIGSLLFTNMLGVERSQVKNLFISSSQDRIDPSIMHIAVVDGTEGSLISTTRIEGAAVPLFNSYGFDLA